MPRLSGRLSPGEYAFWAIPATLLFALTVVGFPALLFSILKSTPCNDACGALGLVIAASAKPILFYAYVAFLAAISVQRVRDLGLPALCGLFVPLMALADSAFGLYAGAGWAFAFSSGVLSIPPPWFLAFALACILFLCVAPSQSLRYESWGAVSVVVAAAAAVLSLQAAARAVPLPLLLWAPRALLAINLRAGPVTFAAMAIFLAGIAALSWFGVRLPPPPASRAGGVAADPSQSRRFAFDWRPRTSLKVAAGLTAVAMFAGYRVGIGFNPILWLMSLPIAFAPVIVPTFLLYLAPSATLMNWIARADRASAALFAASLTPFGLWAYDFVDVHRQRAEEAATLAATPTVAIEHVPDTLVVDGATVFCARVRDKLPDLAAIIEIWGANRYMREDCATAERQGVKRQPVPAPPADHLLLLAGRASHFAAPRTLYDALGQPLELRRVGPERDDLLAVSYRQWRPYPAIPPVLTSGGWFVSPNQAMADAVDDRTNRFVIDALAPRPNPQ